MDTYNKISAHGNFYCIFQNPKMQLSKERVFVVTSYLRTGSFKLFQQDFEQGFPERASPTKKTIWTNVNKFKTEGTTSNLNRERSGCRRTERTTENINLVREKLIENLVQNLVEPV